MLKPSVSYFENSILKRLLHTTATLSSLALELVNSSKCFGGEQRFCSHYSDTVKCKMNLGVYLPPKTMKENVKCPVLYFLNALTNTHENFMEKCGFQRFAAQFGLCVVCPDTSPRNIDVPKHDTMGPSASFYIDATQKPWAAHYQMFTYVTKELIALINGNLPVIKDKQSISGFSMGGYGALICSLKNPGLYQSVSAFAPVCNPMVAGVGKIALEEYIGKDTKKWENWDPCVLGSKYCGKPIEIFIDQGSSDEYIEGDHLLPDNFVHASAKNDCVKTIFKNRQGYNHSHYFISTFVDEHIKFHAKFLNLI